MFISKLQLYKKSIEKGLLQIGGRQSIDGFFAQIIVAIDKHQHFHIVWAETISFACDAAAGTTKVLSGDTLENSIDKMISASFDKDPEFIFQYPVTFVDAGKFVFKYV